MPGPFDGVSAATLRSLASALRSGRLTPPLTRFAISKVAACPDELTSQVLRISGEGMAEAHLALLLDASAETAEARLEADSSAELVWTGPEGAGSHSRDTAVVVQELFAHARRHVMVSSFAVHQGAIVFKPLTDRMAHVPDLQVQLFLHIGRPWNDLRHESELLREFAAQVAQEWPWPTRPSVYYDPRGLSTDDTERAAWHAKCVVVDDELAFVTSANFTEWAQQRNVEAGVLVRSRHFASQLRQQFEALVQSKQVRRLPGF